MMNVLKTLKGYDAPSVKDLVLRIETGFATSLTNGGGSENLDDPQDYNM